MKLHLLIDQYVAFRKALGERFRTNESILIAFGRVIGREEDITNVQPEQANAFLAGTGPITSSWHVRHNALLGFYRYALSRGYVMKSPLPVAVPKRPPPFVPYIYSHEELRRLLKAVSTYQKNRSCLKPYVIHALLLLLYGAGLRLREALSLTLADADLDRAVFTIRETKFFKTRLVPLGPQLNQEMVRYATRRRQEGGSQNQDATFFTGRQGKPMNMYTVEQVFRRIRKRAGVGRTDGARYQPRLHDLRHSFAVHRLTAWYREGADVQKLLPQLSVYLGHAHLAATSVYLSMTPELLHEAGECFERYARKGGSHD